MTTDDDDRLARIERQLAELTREVEALKARDPRPPAPSAGEAHSGEAYPGEAYAGEAYRHGPAPRRRRTAGEWIAGQLAALGVGAVPRDRADVEALVGRYGTVVIAALLILMGVGAFLTWAIAEFTVGPRARVALGVVAAALLGAAGWRLRARESEGSGRRFGDVLLALALAVVHVDAWGAGPYLGLLSPAAALAIAAAASAALALLAWRERDQALFVVGAGGALVAPFVTSAGPGHPYVLPIYGVLVLTGSALALPRSGRWAIATRLLGAAGAAYAGATLGPASEAVSGIGARAEVPALFALAAAVGALAAGGPVAGPWLALAHVVTTAGAVLALALDTSSGAPRLAWIAGAANVLAYLALARAGPRASVAALLLPLALLFGALVALPDAASASGAIAGGAWAAVAAAAAYAARARGDPASGTHVAVAGLASALVPAFLLRDARVARIVALATHAAVFAVVFARVNRRAALLPSLAVLAAAGGSAYLALWERPAFAYPPFLTPASFAAAAVVAGWVVVARLAWGASALTTGERSALAAIAAGAALLWGREELARAGSPDVATFLLVGYFALAGIAAILVGRGRRLPAARQAGLALALYAAFKALVQASALDAVGLRVGSYLLVGSFLLGVGWWYRAAGEKADLRAARDG